MESLIHQILHPEPYFVAYAIVKLLGYGFFVALWMHTAARTFTRVAGIGFFRMILGMVVGILFFISFGDVLDPLNHPFRYEFALLPVRIVEWAVTLTIFRNYLGWAIEKRKAFFLSGVMSSYLLDIPGIIAAAPWVGRIC
jgi:hypothetical protein